MQIDDTAYDVHEALQTQAMAVAMMISDGQAPTGEVDAAIVLTQSIAVKIGMAISNPEDISFNLHNVRELKLLMISKLLTDGNANDEEVDQTIMIVEYIIDQVGMGNVPLSLP